MRRFLLLARLISMCLFLSLPATLLGVGISGIRGGGFGFVLTTLILFLIGISAEGAVTRAYSGDTTVPQGLERSLKLIMPQKHHKWPNLLVFSDPSPNALTVRSLGGRGTILLSQGLIALLNEEELRSVLTHCVRRLYSPGIRFQSFCSALTVWALSFAPKGWVNLVFAGRTLSKMEERLLSPVSSMGFWIIFPIVRFFLSFGKLSLQKGPQAFESASCAAVQKLAQAVQLCPGKNQGAFSLYFIDPVSGQIL